MNETFKAAILQESRAPLVVDAVQLPDELLAGQVLVRVMFSGICGAQLNEIDAVKGPDKFLPHLLGHEGYGSVLAVGPLVKSVTPGDQVVLHWMPGSGIQSEPATYSWRGKALNAGWVTTLSELTIISENRCTRITTDLNPLHLPLLGCAATTAAGVIGNDAQLVMGESVVVIGTGGVGLLCVEAARVSGAFPIVGVDRVPSRVASALQMGATVGIESNAVDLLDSIIQGLGGLGPDVVVETTGDRGMIELAYRLVSSGGRCVLVGVPRHDEPASIDTLPIHFDTKLTGSKGGNCNPARDIPNLARLAAAGVFRLDALPITLLPLQRINEGIELLKSGTPGRVVISMDDSTPIP